MLMLDDGDTQHHRATWCSVIAHTEPGAAWLLVKLPYLLPTQRGIQLKEGGIHS